LDEGIFISKTKYIKEMLKKFRSGRVKTSKKSDGDKLQVAKIKHINRLYILMIDILLYVTASRLDVMQAFGQVARFQATPKENHVLEVKRIFIYLKGTT
jgi:hypothetical protein